MLLLLFGQLVCVLEQFHNALFRHVPETFRLLVLVLIFVLIFALVTILVVLSKLLIV